MGGVGWSSHLITPRLDGVAKSLAGGIHLLFRCPFQDYLVAVVVLKLHDLEAISGFVRTTRQHTTITTTTLGKISFCEP